MYQDGSQWTDFREICDMVALGKPVGTIQDRQKYLALYMKNKVRFFLLMPAALTCHTSALCD
jgi:hypothetical protein